MALNIKSFEHYKELFVIYVYVIVKFYSLECMRMKYN